MPENEQPKIGSNVFVVREGKLLLGERKEGRCWKDGEWSLPGGHFEPPDKRLKETARRELKEETSLIATSFIFLNVVEDAGDPYYINFGFLANDALWTSHSKIALITNENCGLLVLRVKKSSLYF